MTARDDVIHVAVAILLVRVAAAGCCMASDVGGPGCGSCTGTIVRECERPVCSRGGVLDADADGDGEGGHDEDEEERETLEWMTSASANRRLVDPGGF